MTGLSEFYIGCDPYHASQVPRAFISVNRLRRRKGDFVANEWIMDSGAFSQITSPARDFTMTTGQYVDHINRWSKCGKMICAVAQDYMCEPHVLEHTGRTVEENHELTIARFDEIRSKTDVEIMPVLQGYDPEDYVKHIADYGHRLAPGSRVGVGSVCKRNVNIREIEDVLRAIWETRDDLLYHGFGVKKTAFRSGVVRKILYSADSFAWSLNARKNGRNAHDIQNGLKFAADIEGRQYNKVLF